MKTVLTAIVSVAALATVAAPASAAQCKKNGNGDLVCVVYVPVKKKFDPQRYKETFDETRYYERDSNKIPFGSAAWWRQKQFENGRR